jgi:hypothetical protein
MAQAHKFRKGKSLFATTLSAGISTGTSETITPASVSGLPTDTEITLTIDRIDAAGNATPTKTERITGIISGGNLTSYTRGIDGTSDQAHSSGAVVEYIWNADDLNDMTDGILVEHTQTGTHGDVTASSVTASTISASHVTMGVTGRFPVVYGEYDNGNTGTAVTVTWANGDRQTACVTASTTITFASAVAGQYLHLRTYHAASAYSVTLPTVKWPSGTAESPGTAASATNIYVFYYDGTNYYAQLAPSFA